MMKEIEKLKKRVEELEKRPQFIPYYPPIIFPQFPATTQFPPCPICGKTSPHTCVYC